MRAVLIWFLILPIRAYRLILSPWIGHSCLFDPSSSVCAIEALEKHGPARGLRLTASRLPRCNPWGGSGFDPVPPVTCQSSQTVKVAAVSDMSK
ncbi:MAG: membrane protein insertion efficiency factor YidD [Ascidiaceihabitans sp.]|nr:membrane protein insertion efficiency factor YidD [Ascidiaceihabitans sp.]